MEFVLTLRNLSKIMHYLNTSYATYFNIKRKRVGPLYQGRFKAVLVEADEYLHYLSCYIHLNPVRASIVKSPEEYQFSSYKYFTSIKKPPQWLNTSFILSMFSKRTSKARKLYKQFVLDNTGKEKSIIEKNIKNGLILGSEDFSEYIRNKFTDAEDNPELPELKVLTRRKEPSLEHIKHIAHQNIKGDKRLQRSAAIYLSRKYTQRKLNEIAQFYGNIKYPGISKVYTRIEERRGRDKKLGRLLKELEVKIA